jgi:hypothetical protein
MPKITGIIPPQNYELIAAKIVDILREELSNQFDLSGNDLFDVDVLLERSTPINQSEQSLVTVRYVGGESLNRDQSGGHLINNTYFIDFYDSQKADDTNGADTKVNLRIVKMIGAIRAILAAPVYIGLDLPTGLVRSKSFTQLNKDQSNVINSQYSSVGQLVLTVETAEDSEQIDTQLIGSHFTTVKIKGDIDKTLYWDYITTTLSGSTFEMPFNSGLN